MAISSDYKGTFITFGIGDFSGSTYSNQGDFNFTHSADVSTASSTVHESGSDGSSMQYLDTFFNITFVLGGGQGTDSWKFAIDSSFFAAHVGTTIQFNVTLQSSDGSSFSFPVNEHLNPFDSQIIINDYYGIIFLDLPGRVTEAPAGVPQAIAHAIDISATTESAYVNGLLQRAIALANNLGQLPQATINFLEDAAQGTAIYSASLGAQQRQRRLRERPQAPAPRARYNSRAFRPMPINSECECRIKFRPRCLKEVTHVYLGF